MNEIYSTLEDWRHAASYIVDGLATFGEFEMNTEIKLALWENTQRLVNWCVSESSINPAPLQRLDRAIGVRWRNLACQSCGVGFQPMDSLQCPNCWRVNSPPHGWLSVERMAAELDEALVVVMQIQAAADANTDAAKVVAAEDAEQVEDVETQVRRLSESHNLTQAQEDIVRVVIEGGRRMSRSEIGGRLVERGLGQGVATLKRNLAELSVRLKVLPCRIDTRPRGYGLADWD